jgi:hypothetical protein
MASFAFLNRGAVRQDVLISSGDAPCHCGVWVDADCWTPDSRPQQIGGALDLPRSEWEGLASAERLILTLVENGEPYRMILDGANGRFVAHRL